MKTSDCYLLGVFLFGCLIAQSYGIQCQCNDTVCLSGENAERCCSWTPLPIDTDPSSLTNPQGTPLGFLQIDLPGGESTDPLPCVDVTFPNGGGIRYLTALVEIGGNINICVAVNDEVEDANDRTCASGVARFCRTVATQTVTVYIGCEDGCPGTDFAGTFYFRPFFNITAQDDEFFCDDYPQSLALPSSLVVVPPPSTIDVEIPTNPGGGAPRLLALCSPVLLLLALVAKMLATY